jgi:Spy/CpxP family protein refolding chaperone
MSLHGSRHDTAIPVKDGYIGMVLRMGSGLALAGAFVAGACAITRIGRWWEADGRGSGEGFGIRRPLPFLAHRLKLDKRQAAELGRIIDELRTERAQAAIDDRRTASAFADALSGEELNSAQLSEIAGVRVRSAERLRDASLAALRRVHALLDKEQRQQLASLIRSGAA